MSPTSAINIVGEGLVYSGVRRVESLDEGLKQLARLLAHKSKDATFNALSQGIDADWSLHEDIVNPLGDRRQALITVYTIDLDHDRLLFSDEERNLEIPLYAFRKDESGLLEKLTPFEPPSPPIGNTNAFPAPYWRPSRGASARSVPFVKRVITDFGIVWRHILRREYSDHTLRHFAKAILCMGSLDLEIQEEASRHLHTSMLPQRGPYVWIHSRPSWEPCSAPMFKLGRITVVLNQNLEQSMSLAKIDKGRMKGSEGNDVSTYLLLSIRHIALCNINSAGEVKYTEPAALLNGTDSPSHAAVLTLLQAASFALLPQPRSPIQKLPLEIQDRILGYISDGGTIAAQLGCLLELGLPFKWLRTDDTRRSGPIQVLLSPTHRHENTPVESKLHIKGTFCGLSYR
ncbi:hypothetical protein WAI453_002982 [Rhynchosporium graminicola]